MSLPLLGAGKGVDGASSPIPTSGLAVWLKADALSLSDTNPVTSWTDSSGNARHFTEATNPPAFRTNRLNSLPTVLFDGSNDQLRLASNVPAFTAFTLSLVLKVVAFGGAGSYTGVVCAAPAAANDYDNADGFALTADNDNTRLTVDRAVGSNGLGLYPGFTAGTFRRVMLVVDGAGSATFYTNGVSAATDTYDDLTQIDPAAIVLGARIGSGGNYGWANIEIAEAILWVLALNAGDRTTVETYLATRYGL